MPRAFRWPVGFLVLFGAAPRDGAALLRGKVEERVGLGVWRVSESCPRTEQGCPRARARRFYGAAGQVGARRSRAQRKGAAPALVRGRAAVVANFPTK